ncbi:7-cyano-7-deazaguanine synthase QueC [Streptomyces sp. NPDC000405]|uniref:7-cyano-7-deazaguanine synthase QueC n=1 Tax=Streptomyces sp. NPDC000405 TaxID=3161033 RepID=UPI00398CCD96
MTDRTPQHALVIASGGLDSTAVAYLLAAKGSRVSLLSFDYGQRHRKELEYAARTAHQLDAAHEVVDLTSVGRLLGGSALTDPSITVPDGHYSDQSMRITVVPNRNTILLSIAVGAAVAAKADAVAFGAHSGDHTVYPDCRPEFFAQMAEAIRVANAGFLADDFLLLAPFLHASKADIVRRAAELDVPFALTWSCYKGDKIHCGSCGTCRERQEAFILAGITDPTEYATPYEVTR